MQVSGRVIILAAFGIALALSGGAWWYHYQASRQAAEFWGHEGARLLVKSPKLELLELAPGALKNGDEPAIAGQAIAASHDLSGKPGLIHLRFVFTQDEYFQWDKQRQERAGESPWEYALRFADGDATLTVLARRDFAEIGKLSRDTIEVLPSPRIASSVRQYLQDIGALKAAETAR